MDNEDSDQATYIKLESLGDGEKIVLNNTPFVICSEDGVPSEYMPCIENGQLVLRKIDNSRLGQSPAVTADEFNDESAVAEVIHAEIKEPVILNSLVSLPRKKLSYETTFTPAVPVTRGVSKGIIRYGSKHVIIDQHIRIPPREFKRQLSDADDLVTNLELAPCSKQQMHRMLSGFTRMFAYPAHKMPNAKLLQLYASNCISRKQENIIDSEEMDEWSDNCVVPFDLPNTRQLSRKRKCLTGENVSDCSKESVLTQVNSVTNSASFDHRYSKPLDSGAEGTNSDTALVKHEAEPITSDSLSENETFMIIDDSDTNLTQNNLEILLAVASEQTELNQIVTICNENDVRYSKRIIIVANDKIEQIVNVSR